jgi:hypothetical protein
MLARRSARGKRIGLRVAAAWAMVFSCMCLVAAPAAAQRAAACPPSRAPIKLNFNTVAPAPSLSHRLSLSGIANRARSGQSSDGIRVVGLTTVDTMVGIRGASLAVKRAEGFCVYLTSVDIEFGWQDMQVYVPSEYPQGSCEYRAVLDHENQHVANARAVLKEFAPRVRARIESALAESRPILTRRQDGVTEQAIAPIKARLIALQKEFDDLTAMRDTQIDAPSNYAAVTAMCKNWEGPVQK